MRVPSLDACKTFTASIHQFLGFHTHNPLSSSITLSFVSSRRLSPGVSCSFNVRNPNPTRSKNREKKSRVGAKGSKDNVWSVDNELANAEKEREDKRRRRRRRSVKKVGKKTTASGAILVSGAMLMEVETVLQTQEPVIRPVWSTFGSSVSGIWKGVGAVFSPITAEMEPIEIGSKSEHLYDCYTLSRIEVVPSLPGGKTSLIHRKINWVTLNSYGEMQQQNEGSRKSKGGRKERDANLYLKEMDDESGKNHVLPKFESFDFGASDVMEEDLMGIDPGLVFFEDGSYSRGPIDIPVGEVDESKYYLSPTFKFEQCLVKGCHRRLRIVHTIEFNNGGAGIQIMRVAVYEEQWVNAANIEDESDMELDLKPFSQRRRIQPSELTGSWKVFEVSATPIYGETITNTEESMGGMPYVYLCTETLKRRSLPEIPVQFGEEEMLDVQDATVLWLPGGVTGYVDVNKDGTLCIGVGWYSDEGINIVMERDYGLDGKLKEVRNKTEVKRRWSEPLSI